MIKSELEFKTKLQYYCFKDFSENSNDYWQYHKYVVKLRHISIRIVRTAELYLMTKNYIEVKYKFPSIHCAKIFKHKTKFFYIIVRHS